MTELAMQTSRLRRLTDGALSIIGVLMVLNYDAPLRDTGSQLTAMLLFGCSYGLVGVLLIGYRNMLSDVETPPRGLTELTLGLLFLTSIFPMVTSWALKTNLSLVPVAAYATAFMGISGLHLLGRWLIGRKQAQRSTAIEKPLKTVLWWASFVAGGIVAPAIMPLGLALIFGALVVFHVTNVAGGSTAGPLVR